MGGGGLFRSPPWQDFYAPPPFFYTPTPPLEGDFQGWVRLYWNVCPPQYLSVPWSLRPRHRTAAATCSRGRCELPAMTPNFKSLAASDFFAASEAKNPAISAAEWLQARLRPPWSLRFCDAISRQPHELARKRWTIEVQRCLEQPVATPMLRLSLGKGRQRSRCHSRTQNQPKEEVFGTDIPRTSGGHSRGYPGPRRRSGRSKSWRNKHLRAHIHDLKARTSTTLRGF